MKKDCIVFFLILLFCFLTRWPLRAKFLWNWDSVNFALAIKEFNLSMHQPHPPGYPLFVNLAKVFNSLIKKESDALIFTCIFCISLTSFFLYLFGKEIGDEKIGLISASLFLLSPLVWFYSELPLSYSCGTTIAGIAILLFAYAEKRKTALLLFFSFLFGVSFGLRPSDGAFLSLFFLWTIGKSALERKYKMGSFLLLITGFFIWILPVLLSHPQYFSLTKGQALSSSSRTSILLGASPKAHLRMIEKLIFSLLILVGFGVFFFKKEGFQSEKTPPLFWISSLVPGLIFFSIFHFTHKGYVLFISPFIFLLLSQSLKGSNLKLTSILVLNSLLFLFFPKADRTYLTPFRRIIERRNYYFDELMKYLMKSEESLPIVCIRYGGKGGKTFLPFTPRQLNYYFPQHPLWDVRVDGSIISVDYWIRGKDYGRDPNFLFNFGKEKEENAKGVSISLVRDTTALIFLPEGEILLEQIPILYPLKRCKGLPEGFYLLKLRDLDTLRIGKLTLVGKKVEVAKFFHDRLINISP